MILRHLKDIFQYASIMLQGCITLNYWLFQEDFEDAQKHAKTQHNNLHTKCSCSHILYCCLPTTAQLHNCTCPCLALLSQQTKVVSYPPPYAIILQDNPIIEHNNLLGSQPIWKHRKQYVYIISIIILIIILLFCRRTNLSSIQLSSLNVIIETSLKS